MIPPPHVELLADGADILALVKPQFEAGKEKLPPDGVVKSEADRDAVLQDLRAFIEPKTQWRAAGQMTSPIEGAKGNAEFFLHLR